MLPGFCFGCQFQQEIHRNVEVNLIFLSNKLRRHLNYDFLKKMISKCQWSFPVLLKMSVLLLQIFCLLFDVPSQSFPNFLVIIWPCSEICDLTVKFTLLTLFTNIMKLSKALIIMNNRSLEPIAIRIGKRQIFLNMFSTYQIYRFVVAWNYQNFKLFF